MIASPRMLLVWLLLLGFDTSVQLCFKLGSNHLVGTDGLGWLLAVVTSPWILGGIACYLGAFVTWTVILRDHNLSLAFPITSLGYVTILLASAWLLGEIIDPQRWLGVGLISAGFLCVVGDGDK
jgi:drug/metabolite transporter (DMT)-like permease